MTDLNNRKLGAIILAAGKGERMRIEGVSKVTTLLGDKSIIQHIVDFLKNINISKIVVVVGFYKESVIENLKEEDIIFAEQKEVNGSASAVATALHVLPKDVTDVMVVYGDDAVLYNNKNLSIIKKLINLHNDKKSAISFLTINIDNPFGLGRIVRDNSGRVTSIVEEKDATEEERKIDEINPGCFIFSVDFLKKYLPMVEKSPITGEYYLTRLIDLAINNNEKVDTLVGGNIPWRGINTKEELKEAEKLYKKFNN